MRRAIRHDFIVGRLIRGGCCSTPHGSIAWYSFYMSADEAFLRHLLSGIVLQPERMRFDRTEDERGIFFRIHLAKPDMPLVIGKAGQSIKALRLLMKMHAKDGPAISLKLEEPDQRTI